MLTPPVGFFKEPAEIMPLMTSAPYRGKMWITTYLVRTESKPASDFLTSILKCNNNKKKTGNSPRLLVTMDWKAERTHFVSRCCSFSEHSLKIIQRQRALSAFFWRLCVGFFWQWWGFCFFCLVEKESAKKRNKIEVLQPFFLSALQSESQCPLPQQ